MTAYCSAVSATTITTAIYKDKRTQLSPTFMSFAASHDRLNISLPSIGNKMCNHGEAREARGRERPQYVHSVVCVQVCINSAWRLAPVIHDRCSHLVRIREDCLFHCAG